MGTLCSRMNQPSDGDSFTDLTEDKTPAESIPSEKPPAESISSEIPPAESIPSEIPPAESIPSEKPPAENDYEHIFRSIFDLTDEIQKEKFLEKVIDVPTVVVAGDQSSGKSSLLNRLANVDVPTGHGTVTKFPLEIISRKSNERKFVIIAENRNLNQQVAYQEIRTTIAKMADNDFTFEKFTLEIETPEARNITFVDLPGIIHAARTDEKQDVPAKLEELTLEYIKPTNAIILCVVDLTRDLQLNKIFELVRKIDEKGERTIVVFTKIDKVLNEDSKFDNIKNELEQKQYHRYLSYFFVNLNCVSNVEASFFKENVINQHEIDPKNCTVDNLYLKVCDIVAEKSISSFTENWEEVTSRKNEFDDRLQHLSDDKSTEDPFEMLNRTIKALQDLLNGKFNKHVVEPSLFADQRQIFKEFRDEFDTKMKEIETKEKFDQKATNRMRKEEPLNFANFDSFKAFFCKVIESYDQPAQNCKTKTKELYEKAFKNVIGNVLGIQTEHREFLEKVINVIFKEKTKKLQCFLDTIYEIEMQILSADDKLYQQTWDIIERSEKQDKFQNDVKEIVRMVREPSFEEIMSRVPDAASAAVNVLAGDNETLKQIPKLLKALEQNIWISDERKEDTTRRSAAENYQITTKILCKISLDRLCTLIPATIRYFLNDLVSKEIQTIILKKDDFCKLPWKLSDEEKERKELEHRIKLISEWGSSFETIKSSYKASIR